MPRWSMSLALVGSFVVSVASIVVEAVAAPGTGAPEAAASVTVDLDRDGVGDRVWVDAEGSVMVERERGAPVRVPLEGGGGPVVAAAVEVAPGAAGGGQVGVLAWARFAAPAGTAAPVGAGAPAPDMGRHERGEGVLLGWREGEVVELWRGAVGPVGADGRYEVHVGVEGARLYRYESRPDVRRCDGGTARLFPRAWDARAGRFRAIYAPVEMPSGAPVVPARPAPPAGMAAGVASSFRTRSASTYEGAADAGALVVPRELDDGDPGTVWREGLGGDGRGEFITLGTGLPEAEVAAIRLIPGDAGSPTRFRKGNRLRRAGVLVGREAFWIELAQDPVRAGTAPATPYWAVLPAPVRAQCVTVIIDSVYPGAGARAGAGDTALAELAVLTTLDLAPGGAEGELVAAVRAGGPRARAAGRALVGRGAAATAAVLGALAEIGADGGAAAAGAAEPAGPGGRAGGAGDDGARLRLLRVLAQLGDPAGAAELGAGMAAAATPAADRADFAAALAAMGEAAVPVLAGLLADDTAPEPARVSA
ncbi:NADase-type glycan-binding domain-containing protein, partial [Haliangium sp.]